MSERKDEVVVREGEEGEEAGHSVSRRLILVREIGTAATELTAHPHAQLHYNTDTDWLAACTA